MKRAEYIELKQRAVKGGDWVNGHGRSINGMDKPAGSKLARKASDMDPSRYRGGVVSKSYENIAKGKR